MKIKEYNDMKAYLLKPNRLFTSKPQDTIGGGAIQGEDLGSRMGLKDPKPYSVQKISRQGGKEYERVYLNKPGAKKTYDVDDNKLIEKWRKTLTGKNPVPWGTYLKNNFDEKAATAIRKRIEKTDFDPGKEFSVIKSKNKENRLNTILELFDEHQNSDKFLYDQKAVSEKLGINLTRKDYPDELKLIDKFDTREDKIRNAFDKITSGNMTLYNPKITAASNKNQNLIINMISEMVSNPKLSSRYSTEGRVIKKALENYEPYLKIKDDFDYFAQNEAKNFIGKNFQEGFEYSKYKRGGLDVKNMSNYSKVYTKPEQNILNFAIRNAYLNYKNNKPAAVELFFLNKDGSKGAPVDFNKLPKDKESRARILDANKIGFEYEDQFFNKKNLKPEGYNSGLFDEVYDMSAKGRILVPDPNNINKQITLNELLTNTNDKLTIGHNDAKGGVAGNPFNDLRIESGKFNIALFQAYDKIKNPQARKAVIKKLQGSFGHLTGDKYEKAFIESKSDLARSLFEAPGILNEPTYYRAAGQEVIEELGKDFLSKPKTFQAEIARVAGVDLQDLVNVYNQDRINFKKELSKLYCNKNMKDGGRIGFANGPSGYACSIDEIQDNMKRDLQTDAGKSRVRGLLRGAGTVLKNVVAPIDLAIESAFMLPSLLAGDPNAALNNTTLGLIPYFNTTGAEKAQKLLDKGLIDKNQYDEIIQGFKADEAVAGIAKNINDTDQLILGFTNIGILPDEKGEIKQSKASPERIAELTQNFGKNFIELAKERENLIDQNQQYAPALKTAQGMSKTYNAFRQGLIKEATTTLSQQPFRKNVGIREAIADIGKQLGTGEYLRKQKMQDPRYVVEGVGDPYFDYMNQYYSPYMEDVRSAFTGKDPRDRFADLPVSSPSALAQTESTEYKQGLAPFLENLYRTEGPKALEAFAEEQQLDLSQFALKGVPKMKQGGRIQLADGGRLSFAEGPEDPKKRATLKKIGIGGGLTAAVGTGLINLLDLFKGGAKTGVVATKAAESEAQKLFFDLVNAVKNKGVLKKLDQMTDYSRGGAYYEYKGVKVLEDGENIELQFTTDKGAPAMVEYRKPGYDVDPEAGTSYKVPGEFTNEGQEVYKMGGDNYYKDFEEEIIDPIDEVKKIIDD